MIKTYPRLLIISSINPFVGDDSCSVTIRSFLGSWPKEKVAVIVCGDFNTKRGIINPNTFVLNIKDVLFARFFFQVARNSETALPSPVITNRLDGAKLKTSIVEIGKGVVSEMPYILGYELEQFISSFKPDVLYSSTSGNRNTKLTNHISEKFSIPFVLHFLDDWPNVYLSNHNITSILRHLFIKQLNKTIKASEKCFCISDLMCSEYRQRYGVDKFETLLNSVDKKNYESETSKIGNDKFHIYYFGSLYLDRYFSLLQICDYLKSDNSNSSIIHICAPCQQWLEVKEHFSEYKNVQYEGFLNDREKAEAISNADALLFVESYNPKMLTYTRLSLSTRIPEYLASGKPIIAMGPIEQCSIKYLYDNNAAFVIISQKNIANVLSNVFNRTSRDAVVEAANKLFITNHLASVQQDKFYNIIKQIVNSSKTQVK